MTNTTDTFWEVDGVSLQTFAWNITTWGGDREAPPALRGSNLIIPFRPGQTYYSKTPDSRTMTLSMWVQGSTEAGDVPQDGKQRAIFEKNWHMLRDLFYKPRRQIVLKKRFRLFGSDTIYTAQAMAEFAGGLNPSMTGGLRATFSVDLLLADPYFYGDPITLELDPETPEEEFEILGDDRTMDINFKITGLTKRLRVANETEGVSFDYTKALPAGQVASVDVKNFKARHNINGTNDAASASIDHAGDPFWFFLEPGTNKLGIAEMDVPTRGTVWTNQATNPSFESPGTSSTLRTNLMANPELEMSDSAVLSLWRTNYIANPAFETDANNWTAQNAGVAKIRDTSTSFVGAASLKTTTAGAPGDGVYSNPLALSDWTGKPVIASFMAKVPTGRVLTASLNASSGATIPGTTVNFTGTGDWQRVDLPYGLIPAGSTGGPYIYIRSLVATPAFSFWIDQVNMERANFIGELFNGATPNANGKTYAWTGTANASASTASAMLQTLVVNQATNPGFESAVAGGVTNQMPNSSLENAAAYVNVFPNPRGVDATDRANWSFQTDGSGGSFNGTYTATGGPNAAAPSYLSTTTAGTINTGFVSFGPTLQPVSPGNWYTGFFYGKTNFVGTQRIAVTWYDANKNYITDQDVTAAQAITANTWQSVRGTFQAPSGAQYVGFRAKFSGFTATNQVVNATGFMLIPVPNANSEYPFDYFDGAASPVSEYASNWSGTAHQSSSVLRENGATALTNLFLHGTANAPKATKSTLRTNLIRNTRFGTNTTDWAVGAGSGTAALTRQTTGGPTDFYFDGAATFGRAAWTAQSTTFGEVIMNAGVNVPVTPGLSYAASLYAKVSATTLSGVTLNIDWYNASNGLISTSSSTVSAGLVTTWARYGMTGVAPALAAYAVIRLRITGTIPAGFQLDVGCAMLEAALAYTNSGTYPYFDGATTLYGANSGTAPANVLGAGGDFSVAWTGTAQNSSSTVSGFDIWGFNNGSGALAVYGHAQSLAMFGTGPENAEGYYWKNGQALLYPTNQTDTGYVSLMYDEAISGGLLVPGQTYTVLLRYAIYGQPNLTVAGNQEALVFADNVNAAVQTRSTYYTNTNPAQGGNTGRTQELRLTFTVAATATTASIRFYLGRSQGVRMYALDDVMIVPGTYTGTYWDGDSKDTVGYTHVWNGAAYASTSTRYSKGTVGYQNVIYDPSFETLDASGFQGVNQRVEVYRNLFANPQFNTKDAILDTSTLHINVATNPRVQTNANLYSVVAGTGGTAAVARSTVAPLTGLPSTVSAYARATWSVANTAAGTGYVQYGVSGTTGVFPGDYYQLSAYVRDSLSQVKTIQAVWLDAGGAVLSTSVGSSSAADGNWSRLSVIAQVPASAASVVIRIVAAGVRSVSSTLDVTGVYIEYVENGLGPVFPYFDGATAAAAPYTYSWTGGAADSTAQSIQQAVKVLSNLPLGGNGAVEYQSQDGGQNRMRTQVMQRNPGGGYISFNLDGLFAGHYEFRVDCAYISTSLVGADHASRGTMQVIYKDASNVTQTAVSAKAAVSTSFTTLSVSVDVPAGGFPSGNFILRLYHGGVTGDPDLIWDNLSIVAAKPVAGVSPQFNGSSPAAGDLQYAWAGTVDNSQSIATYPGLGTLTVPNQLSGSQGTIEATTEWKSQGSYALRMYVHDPRFTGPNFSRWGLPYLRPGQTYFIRAKVNLPQVLTGTTATTGKFGYTTSDSVLNHTFVSTGFVNAVGTQTLQAILTTDQDMLGNALLFDYSMDAGQVMYMDELEVVHVPAGTTLADMAALPQIIGYAQPSNGYETAWSGAVNSSPSWLFAPMPYKAATPSAGTHALLSNAWANPGLKSLRIRPTMGSSTASYVDLDNGAGGLRLGLTPGQTYTIQARFRQAGAQTGTLNTNARLFQLVRTVSGSQVVSASNQATNTAGEQVLTLTVALEAGATDAYLRLWNGASYGNGDVYFDQILVVNIGASTNQFPLGYFDGSMTSADSDISYLWTGTPGVSTSQAAWNALNITKNGVYAIQSKQWANTGISSLRLVPISTTSNDSWVAPLGATGLTAGMVPGNTYTIRARRRLVAPQTGSLHARAGQLVFVYRVSGTTSVVVSTLANVAGEADAQLTVTLPVGADLAYVLLYNGALVNGGDVWWDNFMVVQVPDTSSPYTGQYFDGDTPGNSDGINNWTGAQYTSTSVRQGVKLNKISGSTAVQSITASNKSMVIYPFNGQESYADITATVTGGMLNSSSYLLRGKITLTAVQQGTPNSHARKIVVVWSTGELVPVYEQAVANQIGTYEYVAVVNTPATGTLTAIRVYNGDLYVGSAVSWDQFLIGQNLDQSVGFFSGATPSAGGDYQYAWSGAANDSTSVMSGTGVAQVANSSTAAGLYAASWSKAGGHSLLVTPLTVSNNSFVALGAASGMQLGMVAGNTYTAQATVRLSAPQTGTMNANARSILVVYFDSADGQFHYIQSNQAANAAGEWFCRVTFKLPPTATQAFIELYNGASLGNGDVWWDEFLLVQVDDALHPYLGDYFDGATPDTDYADYGWTGTPDASTSTIKGVAATAPVELTYRPAWL